MFATEQTAAEPRVSVVIPNYNGIEHLPECLETLAQQTYQDFEIVLVDNASTDESVAWVREHYPKVRIIQRAINGGPVKSTNDGVKSARGEYVVVLDNDTAADPEWLQNLVKALDDHPHYDFAVSMVLLYEENELIQSAGDVYSITHLGNFNRGFGRPAEGYRRTCRIVATSENGVIHRRQMFSVVGLFDEDYYALYEDLDFSLRSLLKGKKCLYVPEARIRHKVGLCREVGRSPEVEMRFVRNGAMMAAKLLPIPLLLVGLLAVGCRELRSCIPLRPKNYRYFPELLRKARARNRARWQGLRMGWAKRGPVWESRGNSRKEIYRWLLRGEGPA